MPSLEDYDADFSFSGLAVLDSSKLYGLLLLCG